MPRVLPVPVLPQEDGPPGFLPEDDWRSGLPAKVNFKNDVLTILQRKDELSN